MSGYGRILRLLLRLDRIKIALWILGLSAIVAITPSSIRAVTEDEAALRGVPATQILAEQAAVVESNAALLALSGPADSLDTFGGRYAFEIGAFTLAIVGLMNILLVMRHTRSEEEAGRVELIRSAAVGPWARLAAVMTEALLADVVLAVAATAAFAADGLDLGRSVLFGTAFGLCGLVFAALTLVVVQVFEYARGATGAALAVLAFSYAVRAAGDVRADGLSYLSPIGWSQSVDAFGEARVWPLGLAIAVIVAATAGAAALSRRRDVGGGLIGQRPGPPEASPRLVGPFGLAWRLQSAVLGWWIVGIALFGAIYGSVLSSLDDLLEDNESMRDLLEEAGFGGDQLRDGFVSMVLTMLAILAAAAALQVVLRASTEEREGRAESILGTAVSRRAWLGAYPAMALVAAPVMMLAAVVGLYGADALVAGEFVGLGTGLRGGLARVPAIWAITGPAVLLYGWSRRSALGGWIVFGAATVLFLFGDLLRLPDWLVNLSPLPHVTHLPSDDQGVVVLVVLVAIGLAGTLGGLELLRRRDIG